MPNMDLASIGLSAVLSAALFIVLEFTIILPLFRRIVTRAVNEMVQQQLIPSVTNFVDTKVNTLTEDLTKSLFAKIKGMFGGTKNASNKLIKRLMNGEDLEDIEDEFEQSTIDKVLDMVDTILPYLPNPSTRKKAENNSDNPDFGIREL